VYRLICEKHLEASRADEMSIDDIELICSALDSWGAASERAQKEAK